MPERKLVIHLEKIGFDRRISEVGEMLATHENDKKEGGGYQAKSSTTGIPHKSVLASGFSLKMLAKNLGVSPQNLLEPKAGVTADGILREDRSVIKDGL